MRSRGSAFLVVVARLAHEEPLQGGAVTLQQPVEIPADVSLRRYPVDIPQAMIERLDKLARKASLLMDCYVARAALLRAAILFWLAKVDKATSCTIHEEIRGAAPLPCAPLHRCKPTWSSELNTRLTKLGDRLYVRLAYSATEVRSALALTALRAWLPTAEDHTLTTLDSIRAGIVTFGRKPKR